MKIKQNGLETLGWLWIADTCIPLHGFRRKHQILALCIEKNLQKYGSETINDLLCFFFSDLLAELGRRNLPKVVESMLHTLGYCLQDQCSGNDSNWAGNHSTADPIDLEVCRCPLKMPSTSTGSTHFSIIKKHLKEAKWILTFVQTILRNEAVWVARLHGLDTPMALFDCDSTTTIFTTTDVDLNILKLASAPIGLLNVISAEVSMLPFPVTGSKCQQLIYLGKWRHGFWYAPMSSMMTYSFPWN
jgi:hypothetical protein